jgi:hypothetical protein
LGLNHPPTEWLAQVKRVERDVDHSHLSNGEVKSWAIPSLPLYASWCPQGQFIVVNLASEFKG